MFLTKDDFKETLEWIEAYDLLTTKHHSKFDVAKGYARQIFDDFDSMIAENQEQIVEMIIDDVAGRYLDIN